MCLVSNINVRGGKKEERERKYPQLQGEGELQRDWLYREEDLQGCTPNC